MSARIHYIDRPGDGIVRLAYDGDVALWTRCRLRGHPKKCALTEKEMPSGTVAYRPVGNQMYRYVRIEAEALDLITKIMDERDQAPVVEQADTPDSSPGAERREGSTPSGGTTVSSKENNMAEPIINATECPECGTIEEDEVYESSHPDDLTPDCESCGGPTNWIRVEPCDKGDACESDDHHYGIHKHVIEV